MQETSNARNVLKKVLIHVIGWPLFLVALYLCVVGGMYIGWTVQFFTNLASYGYDLTYLFTDMSAGFSPFQKDHRLALVFFIGSITALSFFSSYIFATFIFKRKIIKIIFSSLIALSCFSFLLWYSYEIIEWGYERTSNMGCVLGTTSLKDQLCGTRMTEQERKKFMRGNDITEKDLENYRKRYPERFE